MILDYLDTKLDGDSWERLCLSCYRMRYNKENFREVPALHKGDAGIEGYTQSGIVLQCYCPNDENYSIDKLYEHQRDKVSNDIKKFLSPIYSIEYNKLGLKPVVEWHFVVPTYKDKRILTHITSKEKEVLKAKEDDLKQEKSQRIYDHISQEFTIQIKVAEDYLTEISRMIRNSATDLKVSFTVLNSKSIEWSSCDIDKVNNIKRKLLAINSGLTDSKLNKLLDMYMSAYVTGIEVLKSLGESFPDLRKDLLELIGAFKGEVERSTLLNSDKSLNKQLFDQLGNDFSDQLREEFDCFNYASILELKNDIIAEWLADCSMEFEGEYIDE